MSGVDPGRPHGRSDALRGVARFAARSSLAAVFVVFGYEAATNPGDRVQLAADAGVPAPELAVRLNGALMLTGGLAVAAGLRPRLAASILAGTMLPTTLTADAFWKVEDREIRNVQRIHFYKNVAIFGGAMLAALASEGERPVRARPARGGFGSVNTRTSH